MSAQSNKQLVIEALDGSHPAFEQLFKRYQHRVLRAIASIIVDNQAAQDVAQETFLSAWTNLARLREPQKFGGWLNQIAINFSRRWLRDQRKHRENTTCFEGNVAVQMQNLQYQSEKLRQEIWEAIDELTTDHREAVILHYISGYSYKEISEMLSVPVSTVRGRLEKARIQLRKEFLDMVTQLQVEIDSTLHKFLKEQSKQDGVPIEGLILRLIERYRSDMVSPEIAVKRISGDIFGRPIWGRPSPDGRCLAMVNWENLNLAVRDLTTGETRDITSDGQFHNGPHRLSLAPVWSPDGRQIAYAFFNEGYFELRIIELDGSDPRVLWSCDSELLDIIPYDWSSDGKFILGGANRANDTRDIVLVSVANGSVRTLKSLEGHWNRHPSDYVGNIRSKMSFSSDGNYIAYQRPVKENDGKTGIFLLSIDGDGSEIALEGYSDDFSGSPLWAPDGETIVFRSSHHDPEGTTSLWSIRAVDGNQVGKPQFVMRSAGYILLLGFTSEGSLYYGTYCEDNKSYIHVATLDMKTGEATQIERLRSEGFNRTPAWSPDGKELAYVSKRPVMGGTGSEVRTVFVIRSMETGEEREILPEKSLHTGDKWNPFGQISWLSNGRSILCGGYRTDDIHLIDIKTGDVKNVVEFHPRISIPGFVCSPDKKVVYYTRQLKEKGDWSFSIVVYDLETNQEQEIYSGGINGAVKAISPDGRMLAFSEEAEKLIRVIPVEGGDPRTLLNMHDLSSKVRERAYILKWTPDGRYLMYIRLKNWPHAPYEMWQIPAEGGKPEKMWESDGPLTPWVDKNFHPDGKRFAVIKESNVSEQRELWVMENLLTTFASDK